MLRRPRAPVPRRTRAMGEGDVRVARGTPCRPPRRSPQPPSRLSSFREKEGLALINGTDGMLGCCSSPSTTCLAALTRPTSPPRCRWRAQLGTDAVFAADLMALRPQLGQAASAENLRRMLAGSPLMASTATAGVHAGAGRVLAAMLAAGARRRARHARVRPPIASASSPAPSTTRSSPRRARRVQRQLPRRADRLRARLPRDLRRRRRLDLRAPHRPRARPPRNNGLPPFLADEVGVDSGS